VAQETLALTKDECGRGLKRFEEALHGLTFEVEQITGNGKVKKTSQVWISRDGFIRKEESKTKQINTDVYVKNAAIADNRQAWSFRGNERVPRLAHQETPLLSVRYFDPDEVDVSGPASGELYGFLGSRRLTRFVQESKTLVEQMTEQGLTYWALVCDHPQFGSACFLFDNAGRLRIIKRQLDAGDASGPAENGESVKATAGQWARGVWGPIEYAELGSRQVPAVVSSEWIQSDSGGKVARTSMQLGGFKELDDDLSARIEFSNMELADGMVVFNEDAPFIRHELRDGQVVKIVDSHALAAARRARQGGFLGSRTAWYLLSAVSLLVVVGFLVWYRSRMEAES
jgi:hypothetical protein